MKDMDTSSLDNEARAILKGNDRGGYTIPTAGLYPYQWNWDSAFAALGFAQFDIWRAWTEIETLFSGQWDNGMVPHILFHRSDPGYFPGPDVWSCAGPVPSSGISQPPVAATVARRIYERDPDAGAVRAAALFPKLRAWHRWFLDWRADRGAICVTHPWESGRDNTPEWDGPMARIDPVGVGEYTRRDTTHVDSSMRPTKFDYDRYIWLVQMGRRLDWDPAKLAKENPFRMADPTTTFILLRAHRDLFALGEALGLDTFGMEDEIAGLEAGAGTLWNHELGSYDARDAVTGEWANCVSNASFLNWYAGIPSEPQAEQLERVLSHVQYGVPSYDPERENFDPRRYWRGPTWAMMNTMIGQGLMEHGHPLGETVRDMSRDLIANFGFAEYFDPCDGTPAGGKTFTWTAAVWLAWISPSAREA
jgi:glycogen debranching enzyme